MTSRGMFISRECMQRRVLFVVVNAVEVDIWVTSLPEWIAFIILLYFECRTAGSVLDSFQEQAESLRIVL